MARNPEKLRVFGLADSLVLNVYRATANFPMEERFSLQMQLRRGAVSVAANIVEGCGRRTTREYVHFLNIATGSAAEVRYLIGLAGRVQFLSERVRDDLFEGYTELLKGLQKLVSSFETGSRRTHFSSENLRPSSG